MKLKKSNFINNKKIKYKIISNNKYMCRPDWLLGYTSNNLSPVLKSINHISKPHLLKMGFSLLLAKWLSQWVCHIIRGVHSLYLDVFFLEVVTYNVKSLLYMVRFMMRLEFLS